jgi:hypothetical protein
MKHNLTINNTPIKVGDILKYYFTIVKIEDIFYSGDSFKAVVADPQKYYCYLPNQRFILHQENLDVNCNIIESTTSLFDESPTTPTTTTPTPPIVHDKWEKYSFTSTPNNPLDCTRIAEESLSWEHPIAFVKYKDRYTVVVFFPLYRKSVELKITNHFLDNNQAIHSISIVFNAKTGKYKPITKDMFKPILEWSEKVKHTPYPSDLKHEVKVMVP